MGEKEFILLALLCEHGAKTMITAITVQMILELDDPDLTSVSTIYKNLEILVSKRFVAHGIKKGREQTYYTLPAGIKFIEMA